MATIVIAEDEFLISIMLQTFLEDAGYDVVVSMHGLDALNVIREIVPALIITDFMMPLMTGLELAKAVRAEPALQAIPIILVSGAQGAIGRAHPEMFDAVLDKPYNLDKLLDAVKRLLPE